MAHRSEARGRNLADYRDWTGPVTKVVDLVLGLGQVRYDRELELVGGSIKVSRDRVGRMRGDAQPNAGVERRLQLDDAPASAVGSPGLDAEYLDRDDSTEAELGGGDRRRAAEARVRDRRDSGPETLGRTETGDREELLGADPRLALDVCVEPGTERLPVPEARVDGVLQVGMGVDEARDDDTVREPLALAELAGGADGNDTTPLEGDGTALDRGAGDREHPVRGEDFGHSAEAEVLRRRWRSASSSCSSASSRAVGPPGCSAGSCSRAVS